MGVADGRRVMRDLLNRLSTVNKVGLVGAMLGFTAGMVVILVADPWPGVLVVAGAVALAVFCFWFFFHREYRHARILRSGLPARASILEVRSTGVTINEVYPEIELLLEVRPEGSEPYQVRTTCLMDQVDMASFRPGDVIDVTVDAKDKHKVAVGASPAGS